MINKIDSDVTGLAFAEEMSLKTLPTTPIWYGMEPNSYSNFGATNKTTARSFINPSRQIAKGVVTDLDAAGSFNTDLTKTNLQRLMQGFMFANMREKFSTAPFNGNAIVITSTTTTTYVAASGLTGFKVNNLVLASGFTNASNNGLKLATTVSATAVTVAGNVVEASPPAAAMLQNVGYQFASGDLSMTVSASNVVIASAAVDMTTLGLNIGEWIFLGGDATNTSFATSTNVPFYGRVATIATGNITLDKTSFAVVTDTGTGKTVQMYFGNVLKNESAGSNIIRRTYNLERQLGNDGTAIQSEYLEGAVANQLKLTIPQADKLSADLSFVACQDTQRTGAQGIKSGTRVNALGEDAINSTSDVYRIRMQVVDPTTLNPAPLFGYVTKADLTIDNKTIADKAIGVLGAFDTTSGDFTVTGTLTAYFTTVTATQAVNNNTSVTVDFILAKNNTATIIDMPLIGLGGGAINIQKDQAVTVDLDMNACVSPNNYTLMQTFLTYVPTVGMPVVL